MNTTTPLSIRSGRSGNTRFAQTLGQLLLAAAMAATALAAAAPPARSSASGVPCVVVTNTNDAGAGSLRNAIDCASSGDTITFDSSFNTPQTITLTSGALEINKTLVISGPGASLLTISAGDASRVLLVSGNADLYGMTLRDGYVVGDGGGGISNTGQLTLQSVIVQNNTVTNPETSAWIPGGAGIFNGGALTMTDVTIADNRALGTQETGGLYSSVDGEIAPINRITVTGNIAPGNGGLKTNTPISITSGIIANNVISPFGDSAAAIESTSVFLSNTLVFSNTGYAPAVKAWETLEMANSALRGNVGGGASFGSLGLIRNSVIATNTTDSLGGGISADYSSQIFITGSTFLSNTAGFGGAFFASTVSIADCTFQGNGASAGGGAVIVAIEGAITGSHFLDNSAPTGGAIAANTGHMLIERSAFDGNVADMGGAIASTGSLDLNENRFTGNSATLASGGAIWTSSSFISISNTTFSSNTAADTGGAVSSDSALAMNNATFYGNVAGNGGGALTLTQPSWITNTTIYSNVSASGAGGVALGDPIDKVHFVNTLIAGNSGDQCSSAGDIITGSHNLVTDNSCEFAASAAAGLGAFSSYGSFTDTVPLIAGSRALDAGAPAACPATDQRGFSRVGTCDIGAYESRGFGLSIVSGSPQTTTIGTNFAAPLVAAYTSSDGEPVGPGGLITFTAPSSGASIAPRTVLTGVADAAGRVTTTLAANNTVGSYAVTINAVSVGAPITANFTNNAPSTFAPFVSPSHGSVNTSTVSIIGPVGSGFTGATRVSVNGVKMFHVVRSDKKIDFAMKPGVAGTTVDVVLVKAGGVVMTFTQSYSFEGPTSAEGSTSTGATLTTTSGVTITVPPQTALRPASAEISGGLVITYAPVEVPAAPPGDVPLSFFNVSVAVDGASVSTLTNAATMQLPVDPAKVPAGQRPWLYEWTTDGGRPTTEDGQTDRRPTADDRRRK